MRKKMYKKAGKKMLKGGQKKLDMNKNGVLDGGDFKILGSKNKKMKGGPHEAVHGKDKNKPVYRGMLPEVTVTAKKTNKKTKKMVKFPHFAKVDYTLQPVQKEAIWQDVIIPESMWAYANKGSYKKAIREVHKNYNYFFSLAKKLKPHMKKQFS